MNGNTEYVETRTEYELLCKDEAGILEEIHSIQELLDDYKEMLKAVQRKKVRQINLSIKNGTSLFSVPQAVES